MVIKNSTSPIIGNHELKALPKLIMRQGMQRNEHIDLATLTKGIAAISIDYGGERIVLFSNTVVKKLNQLTEGLTDKHQTDAANFVNRLALSICDGTSVNETIESATEMISQARLLTKGCNVSDEAEIMLQRALVIFERTFGMGNIETIQAIKALAYYYLGNPRYGESIPLFQRVLTITENVHGPEHLDTADALRKLAHAYRIVKLRKDKESEPLLQRALAITIKNRGADHVDTAKVILELAVLYDFHENNPMAESMYRQALTTAQNALGADHPDTAYFLFSLSGFLSDHKPPTEAELLLRRALSITEKALGSEHPDTADYLFNLAEYLFSEKQYDEAYSLYEQALAICEKTFGSEHRLTQQIVESMDRMLEESNH